MTTQDEHTHAEGLPQPTPQQDFLHHRNGLMASLLEHGSLMEAAMLRQVQSHQAEVHQLTLDCNAAQSKAMLLELELSHRPAALTAAPAPEPVVMHVDDAQLEALRGERDAARHDLAEARAQAEGRIGQLESEKATAVAAADELRGRVADLTRALEEAAHAPAGHDVDAELTAAGEELNRRAQLIEEKDAEIARISREAQEEAARLRAAVEEKDAELGRLNGELTAQAAGFQEQLGRAAAYVTELQQQIAAAPPADARHFLAALLQRNQETSLAEALAHFDQAFGTGETAAPAPAAEPAPEAFPAPAPAAEAPIEAFDPTRPWGAPAEAQPAHAGQPAAAWEPPAPAAEAAWSVPEAAAPGWGDPAVQQPTAEAPSWGTPWTADAPAQPGGEPAFDFDKAIAAH